MNLSRVAVGTGVGLMGIVLANPLTDKTKCSKENKIAFVKEYARNGLLLDAKLGIVGGTTAYLVTKKPGLVANIATKVANYALKAGKAISNFLTKGKGFGTGILDKIAKNPTKAGKIAGAVALGLWTINTIAKHIFKAGQIDQKYSDKALAEAVAKNVVFDLPPKCSPEEIKIFYAEGGRGIY